LILNLIKDLEMASNVLMFCRKIEAKYDQKGLISYSKEILDIRKT